MSGRRSPDVEDGEVLDDSRTRRPVDHNSPRSKRARHESDDRRSQHHHHHHQNDRYRSSDRHYHDRYQGSRRGDDRSNRGSYQRHNRDRGSYDHHRSSQERHRSRSGSTHRRSRSPSRSHRSRSPSQRAVAPPIIPNDLPQLSQEKPAAVQEEPMDADIMDEEEKQKEEERLIEERRRRRQQILDKFKAQNSPTTATSPATPTQVDTPIHLSKGHGDSDSGSSVMGSSPNVQDQVKQDGKDGADSPLVSAADYDPSSDRIMDDARQQRQRQELLREKDHNEQVKDGASSMKATDYTENMEPPKVMDMFGDDFDMFGDIVDDVPAVDLDVPVKPVIPLHEDSNPTLQDNWDDPEGYYNIRIGELLDNGRYQTTAHLGKGVFSSVVRATDVQSGEQVAIKLIRSNETMYKAGQKELALLNKLMEADPDNKKHVIRFLGHFEHRGHLCLVFESLSMNLRTVVKKYGKDMGISIKAVRVYAQQLFLSLSLLRKCNLLHADIKPDNILVNESKNVLKLCDLGSASDASENEITPYLVSRFYRAPEIILGLHYDFALDVWSAACTLYELFTAKILFPGRNNNQMLKYMMELKGKFPNKMIRKAQFGDQHFDPSSNAFLSQEKDKLSGQTVVKPIPIVKLGHDLKTRVLNAAAAIEPVSDADMPLLLSFVDLLDRCLHLTPDRRITPKEALQHPFITGKV